MNQKILMDAFVDDRTGRFSIEDQKRGACSLFIDAGICNLRLRAHGTDGLVFHDEVFPSNTDLEEINSRFHIGEFFGSADDARIFITGKLAGIVREKLGCGKVILSPAMFWLAARDLINLPENAAVDSLAMIDLSASGYLLIGIDRAGKLKDDLLLVNPRCGAGSGINLDRVLQKLAITREEVDELLFAYLGEEGRERREKVPIRADRCGVFASSATISDKNQGIPLDVALATTLKSEVLKACKKLPEGFQKVYLTGRIFCWQYARNCAEDLLREISVQEIDFDMENTHVLKSMYSLVERVGAENLIQPDERLIPQSEPEEFPSFAELKSTYEESGHYLRLPDEPVHPDAIEIMSNRPVIIGFDVGSTMAKVVVADRETGEITFQSAYSNSGDTIATIKLVFIDLLETGLSRLEIAGIGITGSARYQVEQALIHIYPLLEERISVLVENYAHARGSIDHARQHIRRLKELGFSDVNEDFCILIDIGGEDTKISTIALEQGELFDNAMNLKCSAGTGSLMDTLSAMFNIESVAKACDEAFTAPRSFAINATCAVFLMENASKLQAQGVPRGQILASANWAIVENMARSLWSQLELPSNTVVLLHGQTMLSEPLPVAVTHRLQSYLGRPIFALVPPQPGHRACIGFIRTLMQAPSPGSESISLADFIETIFEKRIILCKGAACGDDEARCNRCSLSCRGHNGSKVSFTLGGCTAINELLGQKSRKGKKKIKQHRDGYKEIWDYIDQHHPRSDNPRRLIIPRSFIVSEWAHFLSRIFERLEIPVHVDNVRAGDLQDAQPDFNIDSCGPQIGAVGQIRRLAGEPHGMILAPQIDLLPTGGKSRGLTCTTNQGGYAVAKNLAEIAYPEARIHLFQLTLEELDASLICDQLSVRLETVFRFYGEVPLPSILEKAIQGAIEDRRQLRQLAADLAADLAEEALQEGHPVALVLGREYILNPGIYDSHIQRLLRDKRMMAIPSYVLDMDLDDDFRHIYWRNSHFIVSLLNAVAHRTLHERLHHARLQNIFQRIETDPDEMLLPVVQISTFSCGPDSVTSHYIEEIMKQRPFLLIQSDAVIKELAHLENRVNTYIKQLESGLHGKLQIGGEGPFEIRTLDKLQSDKPLNRETDVIYFPTMSDNRTLTAVIRGAGYTCIDNFDDEYDLNELVREGRKVTGDAVCAPLAAVYADLLRVTDDFVRRKEAGDPLVAGKKRVLYFDNQGSGPCRQGQYPGVHKLLYARSVTGNASGDADAACDALPGGAVFKFLIGSEDTGYDPGFGEWVLIRSYQGVILQGVLHGMFFKGGTTCRDFTEYQCFIEDFRKFKKEIFSLLESFSGPSPGSSKMIKLFGEVPWISTGMKYFLYRIHGREFIRPIRKFARKWKIDRQIPGDPLKIWISGEVYMRVSQAEDIFRVLLSTLGFRRFEVGVTPLISYMEYMLDEMDIQNLSSEDTLRAARQRLGDTVSRESYAKELRNIQSVRSRVSMLRFVLRRLLITPLFKAAGVRMPLANSDMIEVSKELLPTHRPLGELAPYLGEALIELRHDIDLLLNVGPNGCMVSSMGAVLTPSILQAEGIKTGRIQNLFSADGDVDQELLTMAVLKAMGPGCYYNVKTAVSNE